MQRNMSPSEREYLEGNLRAFPSNFSCWKQAAYLGILSSLLTGAVLTCLWKGFAWLTQIIFNVDVGFSCSFSTIIASCLLTISVLTGLVIGRSWLHTWHRRLALLQSELDDSYVVEESHTILEISRFKDHNSTKVLYFLKTEDDRAFITVNCHIQSNTDASNDQIGSYLRLIKTPHSNILIHKELSGEPVKLTPVRDDTLEIEDFPEADTCASIPWQTLEQRLAQYKIKH